MKKEVYDVLVAGGGTAGIGAAIAAARAGAKTLLVERRSGLGGMAFSAQVHTMCGLYKLRNDESAPLEFANPGLPREFAERLLKSGAARPPVRMGRLDVLPHRPAALALVAEQLAGETRGLEILLHTEITAVEKRGQDSLAGVRFFCRGNFRELEAKALVDCTGDAEMAALAGAAFESAPPDRLQRPAWIFGIVGMRPGAVSGDTRLAIAHAISSAVSEGRLPVEALGAAFREGMSPNEAWGTIDLQADPYDPCTPECLSRLESLGRRTAFALLDFLKKSVPGFENSQPGPMPAQAGIRESRRIVGLHQLTEDDILVGRDHPEAAAYAAWPLELRETAKGPKFRFPENNRPAAIPLACLRARDFENLFMAGRCISTTHGAQASIRVTGTCMATGEAAGKAAAHFAASQPL
ncbi:MAG: FAD-dependent oxidoreductase [Verrucomicrobiota bacterium]